MALSLLRRDSIDTPIEVPTIVPELLRELTLREIEHQSLLVGNQWLPMAECFSVTGDLSDETICWQGDLRTVHRIGQSLASGIIRIDGDAGNYVGWRASGGHIRVAGRVGNWLGGEMSGGEIYVESDAGAAIGAARPGGVRGMSGGSIVISGTAGELVGNGMRGGMIAIGGDCGDHAALNMLAGSIVVVGKLGCQPGLAMRRGTLITFHPLAIVPLAFEPGWSASPLGIGLLLEEAKRKGVGGLPDHHDWVGQWYHGDRMEGGRGELIVAEIDA